MNNKKIEKPVPLRGQYGLIRNVYRVSEQLWGGEYPGDRLDPTHLHSRLKLLLSYGINAFIDLTETDEQWVRPFARSLDTRTPNAHSGVHGRKFIYRLAPYSQLLPGGVVYHHYPIRDVSVPAVPRMVEILDQINSLIDEGRRVYVHCRGGIGRTGTVIGCWLADKHKDGYVALRLLDNARRDCFTVFSPETMQQLRYVRDWYKPPVQDQAEFDVDWGALYDGGPYGHGTDDDEGLLDDLEGGDK